MGGAALERKTGLAVPILHKETQVQFAMRWMSCVGFGLRLRRWRGGLEVSALV